MEKICLNCGKKFECNDKKRPRGLKNSSMKSLRKCNAKTCSSKCSKEWDRNKI